MALRRRHQGDILTDHRQQRRCPVAVRRPGDGGDPRAPLGRQLAPLIDVGGELLRQHDDALAPLHRNVGRGERDGIARRRDDADVVGRGTHQRGEMAARPVRGGKEVCRLDLPRPRLAAHAVEPGSDDAMGQRRHIGAVQVGDLARQIEEMALARNHRWPPGGRRAQHERSRARARLSNRPGYIPDMPLIFGDLAVLILGIIW